eukprot:Nk52_evm46s2309 gene=Nk52_evmTU46s2309
MVLYFTSCASNPPTMIFMGRDKHENEDLIKYGLPEDVWFHVDKVSSAHVYIRMQPGQKIEDIPELVLQDCGQLVKANSIQGNKMNNVTIVYTPWANLKKTGDMAVGQIGFHKGKEVKKFKIETRVNEIVNRLNKTKSERFPNLKEEQEKRQREIQEEKNMMARKQKEIEKREKKEAEERKKLMSYDSLMNGDDVELMSREDMKNMSVQDYEDDFM